MKKLRQTLNIHCSSCPVNTLCVTKGLDKTNMDWLSERIPHYKILEKGEHLFQKATPVEYVFALRSGTVKTYQMNQEGEEFVHDFYGVGDVVGLRNFHHSQYVTSALVIEKAFVCLIPVELIRHPQPFIYPRIMKMLCQRVRGQEPYQHLTNAKRRVAAFFLTLINRSNKVSGKSDTILVPPSNLDISRKIGIANETLSRTLGELASDGRLVMKNHIIQHYDLEALKHLVDYPLET